jgi:stage II sporulation protein AA (anti-sigma F factor antagonist)
MVAALYGCHMSDVRQVTGLEVERLESGRGFRIAGELDLGTVSKLRDALTPFVGDGEVTLDLSELTFIDSTGIHALLDVARSQDGKKLILESPTEPVRRVLEILELDDSYFTIK